MSIDTALATRLSEWLAGTDIALLELRGPGGAVRLVRSGADIRSEVGPAVDEPSTVARTVGAAGVGVFLDRHPLRADALAEPGSRHAAGEPLGFLRIGLILQAITAPCDCHVEAVLADPGSVVGFGTPLFAIVPLTAEETP